MGGSQDLSGLTSQTYIMHACACLGSCPSLWLWLATTLGRGAPGRWRGCACQSCGQIRLCLVGGGLRLPVMQMDPALLG